MYWSRPCYRVLPSFFFNGRFFFNFGKRYRLKMATDSVERRFPPFRFASFRSAFVFCFVIWTSEKKTKQKSNAEGQKGFGGNEWNVFSYPITSQRCKKKQSLCRFLGLSLILPSFTGFSVKNGSNFT